MKKVLSIIASLLALVLVLTACSSKTSDKWNYFFHYYMSPVLYYLFRGKVVDIIYRFWIS